MLKRFLRALDAEAAFLLEELLPIVVVFGTVGGVFGYLLARLTGSP